MFRNSLRPILNLITTQRSQAKSINFPDSCSDSLKFEKTAANSIATDLDFGDFIDPKFIIGNYLFYITLHQIELKRAIIEYKNQ